MAVRLGQIDRQASGRRGIAVALVLVLGLAGCGSQQAKGIDRLGSGYPDLRLGLRDEAGQRLERADLSGRIVLLYFGFTSCPDACPTTLARLRTALGRLTENVRDQVAVVFVSVDPKRDRPEDLATYTAHFGPRFVGATGSRETLKRLVHRFGGDFGYGDDYPNPPYSVTHPDRVFVFDTEGRARLLIRASATPETIASALRRLAGPRE